MQFLNISQKKWKEPSSYEKIMSMLKQFQRLYFLTFKKKKNIISLFCSFFFLFLVNVSGKWF